MPNRLLRAWLRDPAAADPPGPMRRDMVLAALIVAATVLEVALRDMVWPGGALAMGCTVATVMPWRRVRPLAMSAISFGTTSTLSVAAVVATGGPVDQFSLLPAMVLPYALFRWASGRDRLIGIGLLAVAAVIGIATSPTTFGEAIAGLVFLMLPCFAGIAVRREKAGRVEAVERAKTAERTELARELHDTVAHHVSAIAVQAQAGRAVAAAEPQRAVEVLAVIEEAASRTLEEMRAMVGALRDDDGSVGLIDGLAPGRGIADLDELASTAGGRLDVRVERTGPLDDVHPTVGAAVFRIAQEAVTNAVRHARHASMVTVTVTIADADVTVEVTDDGDAPLAAGEGFGLVGMRERAALLGGTFRAGPGLGRGWQVVAVLPRHRHRTASVAGERG